MEFIQSKLRKFDYYAKPEGQDPVNKIMGLVKIGLPTGVFAATYDSILWSKCTTFSQVLNTAGYWIVPLTGMCVAFSSVTFIATNLRQKDDFINYGLGVLASTYVLHQWQRLMPLTGLAVFSLMGYAFLKKYGTIPRISGSGEIEPRSRSIADVARYRYYFSYSQLKHYNPDAYDKDYY